MAGPNSKTAMILSGGGAYGAYEVGVMRALLSGQSSGSGFRPFCPDIVTGTSVGALNGALLLSALRDDPVEAVNQIERIYYEEIADTGRRCGNGVLRYRLNPLELLDAACYVPNPTGPLLQFARDAAFLAGHFVARTADFVRSNGDLEQRTLDFINLSAFLDTGRIEELVHRHVNVECIRSCHKELQIVATNWRTGAARLFTTAELDERLAARVVLASAAIPGIFPPVEIDGEYYADGGMVMNAALRPAIRAGASTLHLVYVDPIVEDLPLPLSPSTAHSVYRSMVISLAAMLDRDLEYARRINIGIDQLERGVLDSTTASNTAVSKEVVRVLGGSIRRSPTQAPYRKVVIHRYCLRENDRNLLQWLSFGEQHISELMRRGYEDAINHNCTREACIGTDDSDDVN